MKAQLGMLSVAALAASEIKQGELAEALERQPGG